MAAPSELVQVDPAGDPRDSAANASQPATVAGKRFSRSGLTMPVPDD